MGELGDSGEFGDGEWGWGEGGLLFAMFNFRADREKQNAKRSKSRKAKGKKITSANSRYRKVYTVERGGSEVIGSEWGRLPNTYQSPTVSCFFRG